jgi:hypothetical protein
VTLAGPAPPTGNVTIVTFVNPSKDRAEQKRQEKLAEIEEQVKRGELKIRQMTKAERKANPPKRREPKRGRR